MAPVAPVKIELPDVEATRALAARLAMMMAPGDVIALRGPLGAGKSEFARALIRARAGADLEVPSPTYTLVQDYVLAGVVIRHVDLYRLSAPDELIELGLEAPAGDELWLVEWPERAGDHLPDDRLEIVLEQGADADHRRASLSPGPSWRHRLRSLSDG